MNRLKTDIFFKYVFSASALFSVLALGAIIIFMFAQGAAPFVFSSAKDIRVSAQRIESLSINGIEYKNRKTFIDIPKDIQKISIDFQLGDENEAVEILIADNEKEIKKKLVFECSDAVKITYPESYVWRLSWEGTASGGLEKNINIILPQPPYSLWKFLSGTEWKPTKEKIFGVLPMIAGTILTSAGAILLGLPAAIFCALFMAEFLPPKAQAIALSLIELLAGIPSVVFGFFALMVIVPAVRNIFQLPSGNTMFSAILVLAIMILPTVISITVTSLKAVPRSVREASLALGASSMQTAWRVTLPHAYSGLLAGIILGVSRALGETMAVILVAGNSPQLSANPLTSVRTLTATIAMEMGYASGRHSEMLFSIGLVLFTIILLLNSFILSLKRRMETA